jgi:putative mycofactocin binding protein MftB
LGTSTALSRRPPEPDSGTPRAAAWILDPACRVRREKFGLLFYDLRGPRLLFAGTGDLLPASLFQRGEPREEPLRGRTPAERRRVERLVTLLVERGFLREQPVR